MHALYLPLLLALALLNPAAPAAWATTFAPQPFEKVVGDAPMIVRGEVGIVRSDWAEGEDGGRRIYTFIDVKVAEWMKGRPSDFSGSTLVVREIGGTAGDVGMEVPGSAKFRPGEEVVLFVSNLRHSDGSYDVRGLMMSKLNIRMDASGETVLSGPAIAMGQNAPGEDHNDTESARKTVTLKEFRDLVASQGGDAKAPETTGESQAPAPVAQATADGSLAGAPALQPASPVSGAGPIGSAPTDGSAEQAKDGEGEVASDFPGTWFAFTLAGGVAVLITALVAWIRHRSALKDGSS